MVLARLLGLAYLKTLVALMPRLYYSKDEEFPISGSLTASPKDDKDEAQSSFKRLSSSNCNQQLIIGRVGVERNASVSLTTL